MYRKDKFHAKGSQRLYSLTEGKKLYLLTATPINNGRVRELEGAQAAPIAKRLWLAHHHQEKKLAVTSRKLQDAWKGLSGHLLMPDLQRIALRTLQTLERNIKSTYPEAWLCGACGTMNFCREKTCEHVKDENSLPESSGGGAAWPRINESRGEAAKGGPKLPEELSIED